MLISDSGYRQARLLTIGLLHCWLFSAGMMIGGYIWGSLGDSLGRRVVLLNAMLGMAHIILIIEWMWLYFLLSSKYDGIRVDVTVFWRYRAH